MNSLAIFLLIAVGMMSAAGFSQDLSGQYFMQTESGGITLSLQSAGENRYTGKLSGSGNEFSLRGTLQNGVLSGSVGDELDGIIFQAKLDGTQLTLTMAEIDENSQVMLDATQTLIFTRQQPGQNPTAQEGANENAKVIINNKALTAEQLAEIEKTYGIKPKPGNYWYDSKSGLYGVTGYPAYGFMYPGHQFGELAREASNGNTGVFVNERELPQLEWAVWSYILGYWIQPGSYWLDDKGNAGYKGSSIPVVNLYVAAQQNAYRGQGGSGDNFWSSRFSAGNYDSGNQRGYVSVPGYGPVGYGF